MLGPTFHCVKVSRPQTLLVCGSSTHQSAFRAPLGFDANFFHKVGFHSSETYSQRSSSDDPTLNVTSSGAPQTFFWFGVLPRYRGAFQSPLGFDANFLKKSYPNA